MAEKLQKMIHDMSTGEVVYVDLTDAEQAEHETSAVQQLKMVQEQEAAAETRRIADLQVHETIASLTDQVNELKEMVAKLTKK